MENAEMENSEIEMVETQKKRAGYATKEQGRRLMELIQADPELASGKFSAKFTHKIARGRWNKIAHELNSLEGARKSWFEWRKTYQDKKAKSKHKKKPESRTRSENDSSCRPESKVVYLNNVDDGSTTNTVQDVKTQIINFEEVVSPSPSLNETERILQEVEQSRTRMEQQMLETNQQMVAVMGRFADAAESLSATGSRLGNVLESVGYALIAYLNRN